MKDMWPISTADNKPISYVTQFKQSIKKIDEIVSTMSPLYVRCIRPNSSKFPMKIVDSIVEHQARFLNFVEHVKVRKTGFPFSQKYEKFVQR